MKKAQVEGSAHILIMAITIFLVLYILFLPPAERQELLGEDNEEDGNGAVHGDIDEEILTKHIGMLEYYKPGFEHVLPSTYIFEAKEAEVLKEESPFVLKNGWFSTDVHEFDFSIEDLENTNNVVLAFDAEKRSGMLWVKVNGETIYEYEPSGPTIDPINIKKDILEKDNHVEIGVSGVGLAFWEVNKYKLDNVRVLADITDEARQKSQNIIILSPTEKNNLVSATLKYLPHCEPAQTGTLKIYVNGKKLFEGIPDCEIMNQHEISANDLNVDTNTLLFETEKGNYRIDAPALITQLREVRTFVEYFELEPDEYDAIADPNKDLFLEIDFIDDGKRKRAELNVNGRRTFIDQVEPYYTRNIDAIAMPGPKNYIEIIPETTLQIPELRVIIR